MGEVGAISLSLAHRLAPGLRALATIVAKIRVLIIFIRKSFICFFNFFNSDQIGISHSIIYNYKYFYIFVNGIYFLWWDIFLESLAMQGVEGIVYGCDFLVGGVVESESCVWWK